MLTTLKLRRAGALLAVMVAALFPPASALASTYMVTTQGNDANSGTSWSMSFRTVGKALSVTTAGDQVWVASGTYQGGFTHVPGVALYGGFKGSETQVKQRNPLTNPTVLDGHGTQVVVTIPWSPLYTCGVDGFIIQHGANSGEGGGGIAIYGGSPLISNCDIRNNTATGQGGGIAAFAGSPTISGCTIENNSVTDGWGGGINSYGTPITVVNCLIQNNTATRDGGAMSTLDAVTLVNTVIKGNVAGMHGGGVSGTTVVTALNCVFEDNQATQGGALYSYGSHSLYTVIGCTISHNVATDSGGGIYADSPLFVSGTRFSDNVAQGGSGATNGGGAVAFQNDNGSGAFVSYLGQCRFTDNRAPIGYGGAVNIQGPVQVTIDRDYFNGNSAAGYGGAINSNSGTATAPEVVKDSLILSNRAADGAGIAASQYIIIANNTIVSNSAQGAGTAGAVEAMGSQNGCTVTNNVIAYNSSGVSAAVSVSTSNNCFFDNTYFNLQNASPGPGDRVADPQFMDLGQQDYHLKTTSPCVDSGTNAAVSMYDVDYDGAPRKYGRAVDIGAFELQPEAVSLSLSSASIKGGQNVTATITLRYPAPSGGAVVKLASSSASARVPLSVTVPAGKTTATFTVQTRAVTKSTSGTISAALALTQTAALTITP